MFFYSILCKRRLILFSCAALLCSYYVSAQPQIKVGAENMFLYLPEIKNKRVAVFGNQTSSFPNGTHLVDSLLSLGIVIQKIFSPEHGFRKNADAGEAVSSSRDEPTDIPIVSLYGESKAPSPADLQDVDVVLFDIQDVGVRFYTYISSLEFMMRACMTEGKTLVILDRPNPNGNYIDGPVLDTNYRSFIGMQPIPIVYAMTIGEYAQMLYHENWIMPSKQVSPHFTIKIVACSNYAHSMRYHLPIPPSPNLKTDLAIRLYPSLCLFEGTQISVGRGVANPFEIFGHPSLPREKYTYAFEPQPNKINKNPLYAYQICYGRRLSDADIKKEINLKWLIETYTDFIAVEKNSFFLPATKENSLDRFGQPIPHFDKLSTGSDKLRRQIIEGMSESAIRIRWKKDIDTFKKIRKKYLIYAD